MARNLTLDADLIAKLTATLRDIVASADANDQGSLMNAIEAARGLLEEIGEEDDQ